MKINWGFGVLGFWGFGFLGHAYDLVSYRDRLLSGRLTPTLGLV